ncbi:2,3,4,5-tetrahydropyridine-2,6-dicarboxylate N-succinyltransferase [Rickettsia typhi]|uniref:2,3,4,5-tetrahydropyridine-2,6-dicarboxylate N-succinyltransferase n=2 Tax=Rickettsia typhi TaxID=785 RepID=DAPD_RICTY|nr:2,3,4,5-tetrahydropyridine-2,6-dicarboxylate N-succinyltransferase [Rickettsia typhi]Q68XH5.1 RecName: Full=2,3,4,5-tetrahydropyridine-2,6-dicarboxylate N-succinyltransferase; AltName: Full=Tetrahydrodipicolinate N-succinyltransferase; Short=THDP succinyltransferase; Short=THP succinyltransferase; Short=Tetrahydropicolinate succinylase [Rickettsia typhi str. Wilmington]AAU03667.1 Succinyl-CoA:tetrahydrodipicolinate N-succinyltransferase [Rickettsia typhi str. Wilmington]AFE54045.1 2,3,4,5-tet
MSDIIKEIEEAWQIKENILNDSLKLIKLKSILNESIKSLNQGIIRVCEKQGNQWKVNEWVKKAILLYFITTESQLYNNNYNSWYDKVAPKFPADTDKNIFKEAAIRKVPGAIVRTGTYIAKNVVIMPSFINIGAYIDEGTMIDTWATIGSCAQIGKNCHISGGSGIGGVLEPLQAKPVIIEDNCFVGARSEIAEGIIVEEGSVISMGVFIGSSTKIVYRDTGKIIYGRIPAYSVVVPGVLPSPEAGKPGLYCVVIVKQVDKTTRAKVSINDLLR